MTYGDGISSVNIRNLVKFHIKHKKVVTRDGKKKETQSK